MVAPMEGANAWAFFVCNAIRRSDHDYPALPYTDGPTSYVGAPGIPVGPEFASVEDPGLSRTAGA